MCSSVLALEVQDDVFLEGEGVVVKFDEAGVEFSDFGLYENGTKVSISYFVRDIGDFSVASFNAPSQGEYVFRFGEENLSFVVEPGEGLECNPRYAYLTEDGDEFVVQLVYSDTLVNVSAELVRPIRDSIEVEGSANLKVEYDYEGLEDNFIEFIYGNRTYRYMFFVEREEMVEDVPEENETAVLSGGKLRFGIDNINKSSPNNVRLQSYISFENGLDVDLSNITFEVVGDVAEIMEIEFDTVDFLAAGEEGSILIVVNGKRDASPGVYVGELVMRSGNYEAKLPIYIQLTGVEDVFGVENDTLEVELPEVNLSGPSLEGPGLDGGQQDSRAFYVGIVVLFVLLLIFVYLLLKLRDKPKKKFEEVVEERQKR